MKNRQDSDSMKTMSFFKTGVEQGIFRSDVNFAIVNLLVREQFDVLLNTDICNEYPFIEVYESIMFTYIRGISTEKEQGYWKTLYKNIARTASKTRVKVRFY